MYKTKELFSINFRDWLNPIESEDTGAIFAKGRFIKRGEDSFSVYLDLEVRDCNRSANIDLSAWDREELKERLEKIQLIKKRVTETEKFLKKCIDESNKSIYNNNEPE